MKEGSEPKVGRKLRALREQQGLSLRALVDRCGLSANAISLIERGENSPTVSTLHRLADALDVSITEFFQEDARQTVVYVRREKGPRTQSNGVVMESLGVGLSNQLVEPFRMTVAPGAGDLSDSIQHPGEEFVHCLEGEVDYKIGEKTYRLERGDSLLFDASQPHAYHNPDSFPAALLLVFQASQDRQQVQWMHIDKLKG